MFKWLSRLLNRILQWLGFQKAPPASDAPPVAPPVAIPLLPEPPAPLVVPELILPSTEPPVYQAWDSLLTYRERIFFSALLEALQWDYWVFAKVRMADVIHLANEPADRKFHVNQILCKHLDFVLCTKKVYRPVLVIELDDSTHHHLDNQARDEFKNAVLSQVGLPLLRVQIQKYYNPATLREDILARLQKTSPAATE